MIKKIATAVIVTASLSVATAALANDIPATPMNHGPMKVNGMGPAGDIANIGLMPVNMLTPPALAVGGAVTTAVSGPVVAASGEPAAAPMRKHHRRVMKKRMMKKKM